MSKDTSKAVTPWNPSEKARAKVKDPLDPPCLCEHCEGDVSLVNNSTIYNGKSYGKWPWVYACEDCDAYVGLHPYTDIPLGTLATKEIRTARKTVKQSFMNWQNENGLSRNKAYEMLAQEMQIPKRKCHFAWFDKTQSEAAQKAVEVMADKMASPGLRS